MTDTNTSARYGGLTPGYYWFFIIFMVLLSSFGSFVNDMYIPALPQMTRDFHCSVSTVQLGLSFGMIGLGLGQVIMGPVSDIHGRKPVLIWSLVLFTAAAVASVFTTRIEVFLVCRLFQGFGASGGYFLSRTIPTDVTGGRPLARMMALIGAINGIAPASAPVLGGVFTHWLTWRSVFIFLALFAVFILLVSPKLKESLPASRRAKTTLWQAFKGYGRLVGQPRFMTHVLLKGAALSLLFAYIASAPFIIQTRYGYSDVMFGVFMGCNAVFVAIGSTIALRFKVLKRAAVVAARILVIAVAAQCVALWCVYDFWLYEILCCPILFCLGMIFTMSNTLAMNEGRSNAGRASAVLGVMGYIFGATVSPLVGMGDMTHSTALVYAAMALLILLLARLSRRIPADLDSSDSGDNDSAKTQQQA
ncbi:MAG: multidrug effflux MFS transporter [Muribaculaceae bacterium]|nr:multidrug effflux MFS transporter [Muribaculaceae bacterium]